MGYQMVTRPMTSRDPERSNSWPQYAISIAHLDKKVVLSQRWPTARCALYM